MTDRTATKHGWAHRDDDTVCMEPAWCSRPHVQTPIEPDRLSRDDPAGWSDHLRINLADDTSRARQALRATMDERDAARAEVKTQNGWAHDQLREVQRLRNAMGDVRGMQSDGATPEQMDEALGRALAGEPARGAFDASRALDEDQAR